VIVSELKTKGKSGEVVEADRLDETVDSQR
jgi:hypothetical protein